MAKQVAEGDVSLPQAGQRATVVGLGREGVALARFLSSKGVEVTVTDLQPAGDLGDQIAALSGIDVRLVLGGHPPEVLQTDVVYASPGVPYRARLLEEARQRGIAVSSATALFFALCRAPIVGITGSSGKTTTTALAGEMLTESGLTTWVGGNIGRPLVEEVEHIRPDHRVVMELSSFQLEGLTTSPSVAVLLNLTPDHLDRHPSFADYCQAKLNILRYQNSGDMAILNRDDPQVVRLARNTRGRQFWFRTAGNGTAGDVPDEGGFIRAGALVLRLEGQEHLLCRTEELQLRGRHNQANVLAAALAATAAGGRAAAAGLVARRFAGVPHRLEPVAEIDGRLFVNDSIATSPARSIAGILAFDRPVVLLAGGRHKNLPLEEWAAVVRQRVEQVVLFGEAAEELAAAIEAGAVHPPVHRAQSLEEAVLSALSVAPAGAVVLLSPACTSFDAFRDYVERGERFREMVASVRAGAG